MMQIAPGFRIHVCMLGGPSACTCVKALSEKCYVLGMQDTWQWLINRLNVTGNSFGTLWMHPC